jgi:hypothetical protein
MSKRSRKIVNAAYHDLPEPLAGWYWTCGCDRCQANTEWQFYGPFKTERRAQGDGVKGSANSAAPVLVTMTQSKVCEEPDGSTVHEGHVVSIHASTREWADKARLAMASNNQVQH